MVLPLFPQEPTWSYRQAVQGGFQLEIDLEKRKVHATYNGEEAGTHKLQAHTRSEDTDTRFLWITGVPLIGVRNGHHQPRIRIDIGIERISTGEIEEYDQS